MRTCAVIVYNPRAVTNRIPYQTSRVFPHTPHTLRTTYHAHATRAFAELRTFAKTRAFLCPSSLFYCYRIAQRYGCHCQFNLNNTMTTESMNTLEHIAHVRFGLILASANFALVTVLLWASAYCDYRKSQPQVNQQP